MDRKMSEQEITRFQQLAGLVNEDLEFNDETEEEKDARAKKMEDDDTDAENAERDIDEDADYEGESGDTNAMGDTDVENIDEAGNIAGIKIEIPGNSYASDFGKAVAREVIESFGPREAKNFIEAFVAEIKKLSGI